MKKILSIIVVCSYSLLQLNAQTSVKDERMEWWREARLGMFIHWGVYAVPAGTYKGQKINRIGEWIMNRGKIPVAEYQQFAKDFGDELFDGDAVPSMGTEVLFPDPSDGWDVSQVGGVPMTGRRR